VIASPYCLYCETRVDPDDAVLVLVDQLGRGGRPVGEGSWVCPRPECLERLVKAAEEERCLLLRPQGVFDPAPRTDGRPAWIVWISRERAEAEAETSGLFGAIYRPFTLTAR
jgi:hypothetical protein